MFIRSEELTFYHHHIAITSDVYPHSHLIILVWQLSSQITFANTAHLLRNQMFCLALSSIENYLMALQAVVVICTEDKVPSSVISILSWATYCHRSLVATLPVNKYYPHYQILIYAFCHERKFWGRAGRGGEKTLILGKPYDENDGLVGEYSHSRWSSAYTSLWCLLTLKLLLLAID